jgi:3-oxoacyl-[acyl-carrier-protein] synthase-1
MTERHLVFERAGLVTAVGLTAARSCAAFRAKVANPTETRFIGAEGEPLIAHQVPLDEPVRGLARLAKMAAMAMEEALQGVTRSEMQALPVLLCVAEKHRPGRTDGLDVDLLDRLRDEFGVTFSEHSAVIAHGRVAVAVALSYARKLLTNLPLQRVLIVAADSLVTWPSMSHYEQQQRLLTGDNSNGFIPGEAAGAVLVSWINGLGNGLHCRGIGLSHESAHIGTEVPLRAEGLSQAIKAALADAQCSLSDLDFRIVDISGEHYYFKEATLALSRTLRGRKEEFDIWHPAECTGEIGAVSGIAAIALAQSACLKGYSKGHGILVHMSNDDGPRAALALRYQAEP